MKLNDQIKKYHPCSDAVAWIGDKTLAEAWSTCERGDWLLWLAGRVEVDRKLLVTCACQCARLVLPLVKKGELRPLKAIEAAEGWARGEVMKKEVRTAADAAYAAAADARKKTQLQCCAIIRKVITVEMIAEKLT